MSDSRSRDSFSKSRSSSREKKHRVAACPVVKYSPIYVKDLKRCKFLALKDKEGDFDATTQLPAYIHEGRDRWIVNIKNSALCNPIRDERYSLEIFVDASRTFGVPSVEKNRHMAIGAKIKGTRALIF